MQAQGQLITLLDHSGAKAVIAPELGAWLLRYSRHLPGLGYVDAISFSQEVIDRYPNQMYAGNPLLFPQVSFSHLPGQEHHYEWEGKTYALPQHGFARRSKWKVTRVAGARVSMELLDTPATLAAYPFSFRATVTYELSEGRLHLTQRIENRGANKMPFSAGIHPYLPVPITSDGKRANCYVEIPACKKITPGHDWESWTSEPFPAQTLPVSEDVSGTMFLTDFSRKELSLVEKDPALRITLNFEQAPQHNYLALWSKSTSDPFYCIEPWTALPNSLRRQSTDLIRLHPGEHYQSAMWMDIAKPPASADGKHP